MGTQIEFPSGRILPGHSSECRVEWFFKKLSVVLKPERLTWTVCNMKLRLNVKDFKTHGLFDRLFIIFQHT